MISFRYHIVTIVAVFLALAVGIVMGTTVIKQGVVDALRSSANNAIDTSRRLRAEIDALENQGGNFNRAMAEIEPYVLGGQLTGQDVIMVLDPGVEAAAVDGVRRALDDPRTGAGANLIAVLQITPKMALSSTTDRSALATLVGVDPSQPPEQLRERAAAQLALRLAGGSRLGEVDVLKGLIDGGFLAQQGSVGDVGAIGGAGQSLVLLSGTMQPATVDPGEFLFPLTRTLVLSESHTVVAAETSDTAMPFVPLIRSTSDLNGKLVTVDDADMVQGQMAVVLGLRNLLQTPGQGGNYGVKGGAALIVPTPGA